jgi:hypothetical protein
VPPSNSIIFPVVAYSRELPDLIVNHDEVEEAFMVPIEYFLDETKYRKELWNFNNIEMDVPFWDVHHSTPLWGATAMIMSEFLEVYKEYKSIL